MYQPKLALMLSSSLIVISLLILLMDMNWFMTKNLITEKTSLLYFSKLQLSQPLMTQSSSHSSGCNCFLCGGV